MITPQPDRRIFLFLQGPHGPFFRQLAGQLRRAGGTVWRVGFNAGDRAFWLGARGYIPFDQPIDAWPETVRHIITEKAVTDLVLYGDVRPVHAKAIKVAKSLGLRIHIFEEGYLRPYWITYERDGSNGHSELMALSVAEMQRDLYRSVDTTPMPPAHWGDMRQHIFYGALYHFCVMMFNQRYRLLRPHRDITVVREFRLYLLRLLFMPIHALDRIIATWRIRMGSFPYHLALLQLDHDSNFRAHSPFASTTEFLELAVRSFAEGAPPHHHLVFKAHPLEDGRVPLRREIRALALTHGVEHRVHYVRGGKLARLLDGAKTAITVNSTAAHQALWRGIPVRSFGKAVYAKPEFVSDQPLAAFFAGPRAPDAKAYKDFRHYLLQTSQLAGGFYAARGRRQVLRQVVDLMLQDETQYTAFARGGAARAQHLKAVI